MLFLCFAVKDRMPLINNFYQYLNNFGLDIWYDRRNIYLGDNRYQTNIEEGANNKNVDYAIVFYSDNFEKGNICLDEYEILVNRYERNELHIFPVFITAVPDSIPSKFSLCKELVYRTMYSSDDFPRVALHVLAKITSDEVNSILYHSIKDLILNFRDKSALTYTMLVEYDNIAKENYPMRLSALFNIYMVAMFDKKQNYMHYKTMNYIYHRNCSAIFKEEKRELQIMENIVIYDLGFPQ